MKNRFIASRLSGRLFYLLISVVIAVLAPFSPVAQLAQASGPGGAISVNPAPNEGANPGGTYYKVVYQLSDGVAATEYWVVPAASPATVSGIRATIVPASIAAQYVTKGYLDAQLAAKADS